MTDEAFEILKNLNDNNKNTHNTTENSHNGSLSNPNINYELHKLHKAISDINTKIDELKDLSLHINSLLNNIL